MRRRLVWWIAKREVRRGRRKLIAAGVIGLVFAAGFAIARTGK
jgi:hypothetical protein